MPKKTFYNLPPEKREVICKAACEEFTRVTLADASIARIVKAADIPRGSFYQYFEDKDDLFMEIAAQGAKKRFREFITVLDRQNGDLLTALEIFFKTCVGHLKEEANKRLERNIFMGLGEHRRNGLGPYHEAHPCREEFYEVMSVINQDLLGTKSPQEFKYLCKMLRGVVFRLFTQLLSEIIDEAECLENFQYEMTIIREGIKGKNLKREEN